MFSLGVHHYGCIEHLDILMWMKVHYFQNKIILKFLNTACTQFYSTIKYIKKYNKL